MNPLQQPMPLKILFADDDADDRFFFDKALKEISIATHLTTFDDGEQLMNYLFENSENLPDMLFLDLSMHRKNGLECLIEIKQNDNLKDLLMIMFSTSYARDSKYEQKMIKKLYKIGAQDFIRKPGDFEQLKQAIHNVLTRVIATKTLYEEESYAL
jgi:CheY-like chemotaxis protein